MKRPCILVVVVFFLSLTCGVKHLYSQWKVMDTVSSNSPVYNFSIDAVYFLDKENTPKIGFAGGHHHIWRTSDRGKTWTSTYVSAFYGDGSIKDFTFKDSLTGWFVTDLEVDTVSYSGVYKTTDGGLSWIFILGKFDTTTFTALYYDKTSKHLFLSALDRRRQPPRDYSAGPSLVSSDDGQTWSSFATAGHYGFAFADDLHGICASAHVTQSAIIPPKEFIITSDGGITWKSIPTTEQVWQPYAIPNSSIFFGLSELTGHLLKSTDAGNTWNTINTLPDLGTGQLAGSGTHLYYQSLDNGFYYSNDSGKSWINFCGPNGKLLTRFYCHNDTIYVGSEIGTKIVLWYNPDPLNNTPLTLDYTTTPQALTTARCRSLKDSVQVKYQPGACDDEDLDIITATITNQPIFTIDPSLKLPITLHSDSLLGSFIMYSPHIAENDTAFVTLHCVRPVTGIIFDTILTVIGTAIENDTVVDHFNSKFLTINNASVCQGIDTFITINSLCGDFSLAGVSLQDTSVVGFTLDTILPQPIIENSGFRINFHLFPKVQQLSPYTANLIITTQRNLYKKKDTIHLVFPNIFFEPRIFFSLDFTQDNSCKTLDTVLKFRNPECAPVKIISMTFRDTLNPRFASPKGFSIPSGDSAAFALKINTPDRGTFSDSVFVSYALFGHVYTAPVLLSLTVSYRDYGLDSLHYGIPRACQVFDTILELKNPLCDSLSFVSFSFVDSSGLLFDLPNTPVSVAPGKKVRLPLKIIPKLMGLYHDSISVLYQYHDSLHTITLPLTIEVKKGTPFIDVAPLFNFGTINLCKPKTKPLIFGNSRCYDVNVVAIDWFAPSPDFQLLNLPQAPFILHSGEKDTLIIRYAAGAIGSSLAKLHIRIEYDGKNYDSIVTVIGSATTSIASSLSDSLLWFDSVSTCNSRALNAYLTNDNCDSIVVSQYQSLNQLGFIITDPPLPITVGPGDSMKITILYAPKNKGSVLDSILFLAKSNSGSAQIKTLLVSGIGESDGGTLSYEPKTFSFTPLSICGHDSLSGFFTNIGCDSLHFDPIHVLGNSDFTLSANTIQLTALAPRDSLHYKVYFNPVAKGQRQGMLVVTTHGAANETDSIPFTSIVKDGTRILSSSVETIDFGKIYLCDNTPHDTVFHLTNSGCDTIQLSGAGFKGSGFGTNTAFPITLLPGQDIIIPISALVDTAGGKTSASALLSFASNADSISPIRPILLTAVYSIGRTQNVSFFLDPTPQSGGDQSSVMYHIKQTPNTTFSGSGVQSLGFSLNYNNDLLTFDQANSKNISLTGSQFTITNPSADASGVLATLAFRAFLTKDSVTNIDLVYPGDSITIPCGILSVSGGGQATFSYAFLCGERSIFEFMNGTMPVKIVAIHPNPVEGNVIIIDLLYSATNLYGGTDFSPSAQYYPEKRIEVRSAITVHYPLEIDDVMGREVYRKEISSSDREIQIPISTLSAGVYMLRIGNASQSFVKVK